MTRCRRSDSGTGQPAARGRLRTLDVKCKRYAARKRPGPGGCRRRGPGPSSERTTLSGARTREGQLPQLVQRLVFLLAHVEQQIQLEDLEDFVDPRLHSTQDEPAAARAE